MTRDELIKRQTREAAEAYVEMSHQAREALQVAIHRSPTPDDGAVEWATHCMALLGYHLVLAEVERMVAAGEVT